MLLCTIPMLLCLFPMLLCTFPLPQRRRSPSGKFFHGTPASSSSATALPARNTSASAPWPATSSRWLFAILPLANSSATAPRPAAFASCPYQQLPHGTPASCFRRLSVPAAPPRRPGQQQTSSGREEYSGLASNLAHLGRIC